RPAERERNADHPFAAHHADLERAVALDRDQQRDEGIVGEVDVPRGVAGLVEHLAELERHALKAAFQAPVGGRGQRGEQAVCGMRARDAGDNGSGLTASVRKWTDGRRSRSCPVSRAYCELRMRRAYSIPRSAAAVYASAL